MFGPSEFWDTIGSPKYVTAPMVDYSELPFRLLTRKYGANLCFTPMLHSRRFSLEPKYRKSSFNTTLDDHPLAVQVFHINILLFCTNSAIDLYNAASHIINSCEIIDVNLGCPQKIAKKGCYGAFIMDDWILINDIIRTAIRELNHPISCKIRIYPNNPHKSLQYSQMLINAGCQLLSIHGRGPQQKGSTTGLADWNMIKLIKEHSNIPIIANGNIMKFNDIDTCITHTNSDAVMSAALFSNLQPYVWDISNEFLDLCDIYPISVNHIRGHLFKIFHLCLPLVPDIRNNLCAAQSINEFRHFVKSCHDMFSPLIDDNFSVCQDLKKLIERQKYNLLLKQSPYKFIDPMVCKETVAGIELEDCLNISPYICHSVPHYISQNT